jgi:hypothetical protein
VFTVSSPVPCQSGSSNLIFSAKGSRKPDDVGMEERQSVSCSWGLTSLRFLTCSMGGLQLIVDYIFGQLVTRILCYYDGQNIKEGTVDTLERALFKVFLNSPVSKGTAINLNREVVVGLFKEMLGQVARFR